MDSSPKQRSVSGSLDASESIQSPLSLPATRNDVRSPSKSNGWRIRTSVAMGTVAADGVGGALGLTDACGEADGFATRRPWISSQNDAPAAVTTPAQKIVTAPIAIFCARVSGDRGSAWVPGWFPWSAVVRAGLRLLWRFVGRAMVSVNASRTYIGRGCAAYVASPIPRKTLEPQDDWSPSKDWSSSPTRKMRLPGAARRSARRS